MFPFFNHKLIENSFTESRSSSGNYGARDPKFCRACRVDPFRAWMARARRFRRRRRHAHDPHREMLLSPLLVRKQELQDRLTQVLLANGASSPEFTDASALILQAAEQVDDAPAEVQASARRAHSHARRTDGRGEGLAAGRTCQAPAGRAACARAVRLAGRQRATAGACASRPASRRGATAGAGAGRS